MKRPGRILHPLSAVLAVVGLLTLWILLSAVRVPEYGGPRELAAFARIPVQEGGRIKPVDTVARNTLMILSGKQTYRDAEGRRHQAVEWFAGLVLDPRAAAEVPVFRIDHPDLVGLLGFHNEERKYFSLSEIAPHFQTLSEQFQRIPDEPRLRDPFEKALAKLQNTLALYDRTAYAFVPPPFFGDAVGTYAMVERIRQDVATADPGSESRQTAINALRLFENQFGELAATAGVQVIPPTPGEADGTWQSLGAVLLELVESGRMDPVVEAWARASAVYRSGDHEAFNSAMDELADRYAGRSGADAGKSGFEAYFNAFAPFGTSMQLYLLVLIVAAFSWLGWTLPLARTAFWLLALGFAVHTFGMAARVYLQERPPVTNLYSSAIFVGWAAVPLCLYLERRYLNGMAAAAAAILGFSTLIVAHHLGSSGDTLELMRAVLDSNFWLATHVPTVTLGYSATFLAGFIAILYLVRTRLPGGLDAGTRRVIGGMVYGAVCFALLFSFVGTVLGGIWADQSWGRFWGWDPKENGALMIVLWNALILHAHWAKVVSLNGIMQLAVVGNIITAWSWFGTNMLGVGLHSYGFMDAAFFWLMAFIVSQLAFIGLGYLPERPDSRSATAAGAGEPRP